jgi:hypothetical protein
MKRIADERNRIQSYQKTIASNEFFNDRRFKDDLEWLILGYLQAILVDVKWPAPEFAKRLVPPEPDFATYDIAGEPFRRIEVTEVLRPEYRRGAHYRELVKSSARFYEIPEPHPKPWTSFYQTLRSKLSKPYASGSWLLIYHDMSASEFDDYSPWHDRIFREAKTWTTDSESAVDVTRSQYESIYVVDASGVGAVRLYPHWDVVRPSPFP